MFSNFLRNMWGSSPSLPLNALILDLSCSSSNFAFNLSTACARVSHLLIALLLSTSEDPIGVLSLGLPEPKSSVPSPRDSINLISSASLSSERGVILDPDVISEPSAIPEPGVASEPILVLSLPCILFSISDKLVTLVPSSSYSIVSSLSLSYVLTPCMVSSLSFSSFSICSSSCSSMLLNLLFCLSTILLIFLNSLSCCSTNLLISFPSSACGAVGCNLSLPLLSERDTPTS